MRVCVLVVVSVGMVKLKNKGVSFFVMKLASWNVNGLRAVEKKGELEKFIKKHNPDIFLIQETKSQEDQVKNIIEKYDDYDQFYQSAKKKGYSGVAIWVKKGLDHAHLVRGAIDNRDDDEGRVIRVDVKGYTIFSVYFPNGGKSEQAWEDKLVFYEDFLKTIDKLRAQGKKVIWAGDVNCAHEEIDIARPKENEGKIGFHPKERAWVSKVIEHGWIDVFRKLYPQKVVYSWWHLISRARERNVGWRIDYFFTDEEVFKRVKDCYYDTDQMGSDHCPIILELR
jgi:exodeoxyribonuclease-3